ncbi:MAG: efflux RND transporter permease subunit, partial [Planctomycetota bacterium]
ALCGVLLRPTPEKRGWFFGGFNRGFDWTTTGYRGVVGLLVRRTAITMVVFVGLLAAVVFGFVSLPTGFIPDEDQGYLIINAQLPDGATLERTQEVLDQINQTLVTTDGVSDVIAVTGYSALDALIGSNAGCFFVVLEPWEERTDRETHVMGIVHSLQPRLAEIQEATCFAFIPPPITGLGNAGGFEFQLLDQGGGTLIDLENIGNDMVAEGNANPVLARMNSNLRANVPQLYLDVNRVKAKKLGIPLGNLFGTLQAYLGSAYVNDFNLASRVYKVQIQADQKFRSRVKDIERLDVRNRNGDMVPLSTLLSVRDTAGAKTVFRFNNYPSATITGQPAAGYSSGQSVAAIETLAGRVLPPSMKLEWSGVTKQQIEAGNQAPFIFAMAIIFVYLFLAAQYESWSIPLAVLLSVPLAILGAVAATWIRAFDNNIYTQIGLVLLIGLSAKSAILIVEFAKQRRAEGLSVMEAAVEAARLRFRAILMTAFSFILGVVPLVIASGAGAASRRALGTAVFGGMLAATVFGVFLIPVLYVVIQRTSEWLRGISGK